MTTRLRTATVLITADLAPCRSTGSDSAASSQRSCCFGMHTYNNSCNENDFHGQKQKTIRLDQAGQGRVRLSRLHTTRSCRYIIRSTYMYPPCCATICTSIDSRVPTPLLCYIYCCMYMRTAVLTVFFVEQLFFVTPSPSLPAELLCNLVALAQGRANGRLVQSERRCLR